MTVFTEGMHTAEYLVSEANGYRSREQAIITGSTDLQAGTVLGATMTGATAAATANTGNTGNGTFGTITPGGAAQAGTYQLIMISATAFTVEGPNGVIIGEGKAGSAFAAGGLGFTLTAGSTPFVASDGFAIVVAAGTMKYEQLNLSATDGSQFASAVLYEFAKVSAGDVVKTITARDSEVNGLALVWPSGISTSQKSAAAAQLAKAGIIIRN